MGNAWRTERRHPPAQLAKWFQAALPSLANAARRIGVWIVALLGIGLLCSNAPKASAAAVVFTFDNINRSISDDSALGLNDARIVSTPFTMALEMSISLTISGDFNGDLYVQVMHGSEFSVLLSWAVNVEVVPEPNTVGLLAAGFCLLCLLRRKRHASRIVAEA